MCFLFALTCYFPWVLNRSDTRHVWATAELQSMSRGEGEGDFHHPLVCAQAHQWLAIAWAELARWSSPDCLGPKLGLSSAKCHCTDAFGLALRNCCSQPSPAASALVTKGKRDCVLLSGLLVIRWRGNTASRSPRCGRKLVK